MTQQSVDADVNDALAALQAERNATWPHEQLAAHAALRLGLEADADRDRIVGPGFHFPDVELDLVGSGATRFSAIAEESAPVVVLMFRFESCPACSAALGAYRLHLVPGIRDLGGTVVAISPQTVDLLAPVAERLGGDIVVGSCAGTDLLDQLGIGFEPDVDARAASLASGHDMGALLGTGSWQLPYPTALVVDADRLVHYADAHPDWMVRTPSATLMDQVGVLAAPKSPVQAQRLN